MPAPTFTTHVDGTAMDWSVLAGDLASFRSYLNGGIVNADWADGSIRREHLVAPVVRGFPSTGLESTFQGVWWREYGQDEIDAVSGAEWGSTQERLTVFPALCGRDGRWRTPIGATIYLPVSSDVEITCQAALHCISDVTVASYPTGGGGDPTGDNGGHYMLVAYNRVSNAEVDLTESKFPVYPIINLSNATQGPLRCVSHRRLTAGHWDIQLVYVQNNESVLVWQHDLHRVTMKIEAH